MNWIEHRKYVGQGISNLEGQGHCIWLYNADRDVTSTP